jgi:hypothetical protein
MVTKNLDSEGVIGDGWRRHNRRVKRSDVIGFISEFVVGEERKGNRNLLPPDLLTLLVSRLSHLLS